MLMPLGFEGARCYFAPVVADFGQQSVELLAAAAVPVEVEIICFPLIVDLAPAADRP